MKKILSFLLIFLFPFQFLFSCGEAEFILYDTDISLAMYEEYKLDYKLSGADEDEVTWNTSDTQIATVVNGTVTTLRSGSVVITGTFKGQSYDCDILVTRNTVGRALSVSQSNITLPVGESAVVVASFKESGNELSVNVIWESSLPDVVAVDAAGRITALARGTAVVSAFTRYKGQQFTKDVVVRATVSSGKNADLLFSDLNHKDSSLTPLGDEKTTYGFEDGETAYEYKTSGGFSSRIFADGAYTDENEPLFDRLIFKIKFTETPTEGTSLWLGNYKTVVKGMSDLKTTDSCFVFFDYKGRIAEYLRIGKPYTVVINLNKRGDGTLAEDGSRVYDYGFAFNSSTVAYVGAAVLCTEDYYLDHYAFEEIEELPDLNYIYAETGSGLDVGAEPMNGLEKYWIAYSSGTSETWNESLWTNRVAIGGIKFSDYRNYAYMRMDVMFTDVGFRELIVWTGGYTLACSPSGTLRAIQGESLLPDDLNVYDEEEEVTGKPFETGKIYTFRIRIQRDNTENVAFGFSVNSATADKIYFTNPTFTDY